MIIMIQQPAIVENVEEVAPLGLMEETLTPLTTTTNFYQPIGLEVVNQQISDYIKQQEEEALKRQQEEEAARQKAIQEELERQARQPHFNPYDVTELSHITDEEFYDLLSDTALIDVAWTFKYAEDNYGVNGLFLLGLVALESGWGESERSQNHRERNLTGYNIVSSDSSYYFETRSDSVLATAKLLANDYLTSNGRYYNGVSVEGINVKYCAEEDWSNKVIAIANKLLNELKNQ